MGYGLYINGKHTPITPWVNSWAAFVSIKPPGRPQVVPLQTAPTLTKDQQLEDARILKDAEYFHQI